MLSCLRHVARRKFMSVIDIMERTLDLTILHIKSLSSIIVSRNVLEDPQMLTDFKELT